MVGKRKKGKRKSRDRWAVVDQSTISNFQINTGIKILNTYMYVKDQNEMNYDQQVVLSWYYFFLC